MKKIISIALAGALLTGTLSCNGYYRFFISPQPVMPVVHRPPSPGTGYIWIEGEWFWNGRTYAWRNGYWTLPLDGHIWVQGTWRKKKSGWYWQPGYWRR